MQHERIKRGQATYSTYGLKAIFLSGSQGSTEISASLKQSLSPIAAATREGPRLENSEGPHFFDFPQSRLFRGTIS